MKKRLAALALVLFSTISLASCNQNNKKITFEDYSSSQIETSFTSKLSELPKKVEAEYTGDYIYKSTSYTEKTRTTQYEDNDNSKTVNKEIDSYSSVKKVDYDKQIYTNSINNKTENSVKSATNKQKFTEKTSSETIFEKDGTKFISISKTDKNYRTITSNYVFADNNDFKAAVISAAFNSSDITSLAGSTKSYYIDGNTYTLVVEYNNEKDNSKTTKKQIVQVTLEENEIIIKSESSSISTNTSDKKYVTTVEEYENKQTTVTYKDVEIKYFDYEDYKCLDEEDN